jgi:3-hydroxyisobutyrate dehydrogenase-like beta-hydroxyacid dehydrogenase
MNVGFIGLGLMGTPMANRILDAGHTLHVYNRTKEKSRPFIERGAIWCDSPAEVARRSDVVCSMLSAPEVLENVALGNEGVLEGLRPGATHADSSTVSPVLTRRLEEQYRNRGRHFIHVPVLGSVPNAAEGSLLLFAGGDEEGYKKGESILKLFGSKIWRFPKAEQATNTKLLCNFFIATMISSLAQGIVFAEKNGIDPATILDILGNSALGAPTYQVKGKSMVENKFAPRFFLAHMLKDINLFLGAAKASDVRVPAAEVARELYSDAVNAGLEKEDYSAVIKVLRSYK